MWYLVGMVVPKRRVLEGSAPHPPARVVGVSPQCPAFAGLCCGLSGFPEATLYPSPGTCECECGLIRAGGFAKEGWALIQRPYPYKRGIWTHTYPGRALCDEG